MMTTTMMMMMMMTTTMMMMMMIIIIIIIIIMPNSPNSSVQMSAQNLRTNLNFIVRKVNHCFQVVYF